jgi:large subunit ribosomal protein L9
MEVILLERIASLGQMGDVVRVKDGYARNFLLPQGKALRASEASRKKFESERHTLEARNLERKSEAEQVATKLSGKQFVVVRQAGETGHLYGSVTTRDVAEIIEAGGFTVERGQVALNQPIKMIGMHEVSIALHPEVDTRITVNVARSEDEAARQARGEDVTLANRGDDEEVAAAPAPEELLEQGVELPEGEADVGDTQKDAAEPA